MNTQTARTAILLALLGAFGVGCPGDKDGEGKDTDGPPSVDLDKDGYGESADCDDQSANIFPGADEQCNGIDDDCDGEIDEAGAIDGIPGYTDADGDTYGASGPGTICPGAAGYVSIGGDCDDSSAAVNPAATESCDTVDNDCDGLTDEPGTADGSTYYLDQDGDGYGHPILTGVACAVGDGYSEDNSDCDDQDPDRNPGNTEICSNRVDDDCDGTTDEADDAEAPTWYTDADGDGYGTAGGPTLESCDEPEGYADNTDDCDDSNDDVNPGASDREDGLDNDCDGEIDEGGGAVLDGGYGYEMDVSGSPDIEGIFYATVNGECYQIYSTDAYEVGDELACEGCNYTLYIAASYNAELGEMLGVPECDWSEFSIWPEVEEFGTLWSFVGRGGYYEQAYYYSVETGDWYPSVYAFLYPRYGYGQWYWFYEESGRDYEAGIFLFSPYLYYYYGYYGYDDGGGPDGDVDTGGR